MALKKSDALSQIRERIRDTQTSYHYSTSLLTSLLGAALREMEPEIRQVDPDFYLTRQTVKGYTDALDPGTYEFYPLPQNVSSVRWIERADGTFHPKLRRHEPRDAEFGRFPSTIQRGSLTFDGTSFTNLPAVGAVESYSIWGDRFRVLPAPSAAGPEYGVYYDRQVVVPSGENELIDVPVLFEEPVVLSTSIRALRLEGESLAELLATQLYGNQREEGDLARAKRAHSNRTRRDLVLQISG